MREGVSKGVSKGVKLTSFPCLGLPKECVCVGVRGVCKGVRGGESVWG